MHYEGGGQGQCYVMHNHYYYNYTAILKLSFTLILLKFKLTNLYDEIGKSTRGYSLIEIRGW